MKIKYPAIAIATLIIILLAIPITLFQTQQNQDIRQEAASEPCVSPEAEDDVQADIPDEDSSEETPRQSRAKRSFPSGFPFDREEKEAEDNSAPEDTSNRRYVAAPRLPAGRDYGTPNTNTKNKSGITNPRSPIQRLTNRTQQRKNPSTRRIAAKKVQTKRNAGSGIRNRTGRGARIQAANPCDTNNPPSKSRRNTQRNETTEEYIIENPDGTTSRRTTTRKCEEVGVTVRGGENVTIKPGTSCEETTIIMNITEYNAIIDCFSDTADAKSCDSDKHSRADLNNDGKVNQTDYNLFLSSVQTE